MLSTFFIFEQYFDCYCRKTKSIFKKINKIYHLENPSFLLLHFVLLWTRETCNLLRTRPRWQMVENLLEVGGITETKYTTATIFYVRRVGPKVLNLRFANSQSRGFCGKKKNLTQKQVSSKKRWTFWKSPIYIVGTMSSGTTLFELELTSNKW